ncbi:MAG: TonB-dependent receptor [Gemmatimonadales bacterium]
MRVAHARRRACLILLGTIFHVPGAHAQQRTAATDATLQGKVTDAASAAALEGITVIVTGGRTTVTDAAGRYRVVGIVPGEHAVTFRWLGYSPHIETLTFDAGASLTLDVAMKPAPVPLGLVRVSGASRTPERVVDAPAAVVTADPARVRDLSGSGQVPLLVGDLAGVRTSQAGLYDFNLNTHGFNTPLNRGTLVLVDGRDVSTPILGNQDWAGLSVLEDETRVEMVRGPGSALYGANAFSGILAITTPAVRETPGARVDVTAGELSTFKTDARYAFVTHDQRMGFRASAGFEQSDTWDRARTNTGDLTAEYAVAGIAPGTIVAPAPGYDLMPLNGQVKAGLFGLPGAASGAPDPVQVYFATLRGDYYLPTGSVFTAEGGDSHVANAVFNLGTSRSQERSADEPWMRLAWTGDDFSLFSYYTGRHGVSYSLAAAEKGLDDDATLHLEGQITRHFDGSRGRVVVGGSVRNVMVDSRGTLLAPRDDGRSDSYYAAFQQLDYALAPRLTVVAGTRLDGGSAFSIQFSPSLGIVIRTKRDQSLRFTWKRGYLAPSAFQRFLQFPGGAPVDLTALEQGLRASPLGPALAGVPVGTLFTNSAAVPVWAQGNPALQPEVVNSYETGYKAQMGRFFFSADAYWSEVAGFNTDLLPGVNAAFPLWTAPNAVPAAAQAALQSAVIGAAGPALSRLANGNTAFVVSFGNAGRATEHGAELGIAYQATDAVRFDANYAYYAFHLDQATFAPGDTIRSNTPAGTVNVAVTYGRPDGVRLRIGWRFEDAYRYRVGTWEGPLPSTRALDLDAAWPLGNALSVSLDATDLLDERRIHMLGGSVIGRRLLATFSWRP